MPEQLNNIKPLKQKRKTLRNNSTVAEAFLWKLLQKSQLDGKKFRRQHSVGYYILDFYCASDKLAVELDGANHFTEEGQAYDEKRTDFLNSCGIRVLRFENKQVFENTESVLMEIRCNLTTPTPPKTGGEHIG